jgi:hypothetical protein
VEVSGATAPQINQSYSFDLNSVAQEYVNVSAELVVATTTVISSSVNPSVRGQAVTFTAAVNPVPDGGTVAFTDGGVVIPGCAGVGIDVATGRASCQSSRDSAGGDSISATYSGDANFQGSASSALTQTVQRTATATQVSASTIASKPGQLVVFTAVVSPRPDGGTLAFADDGATMSGCGALALSSSSSQVACRVTYRAAGTHTIVVTYGGDANFDGSQSRAQTYVVTPAGSPLALVTGPTSTDRSVSDGVECSAFAQQPCQVLETLTTTEITRHGHAVGVSTVHPRRERHTVIVGSKLMTVPPGRTIVVTVGLNRAGRRLLRQFGKLPVTLTIAVTSDGRRAAAARRKVTVAQNNSTMRSERRSRPRVRTTPGTTRRRALTGADVLAPAAN